MQSDVHYCCVCATFNSLTPAGERFDICTHVRYRFSNFFLIVFHSCALNRMPNHHKMCVYSASVVSLQKVNVFIMIICICNTNLLPWNFFVKGLYFQIGCSARAL